MLGTSAGRPVMDILTNKIVKARKEHKCDYCGKTIEVEEQYRTAFLADGGDSWTWDNCLECEAFVDKFKLSGDGEGLSTMMFEDAVYDECQKQGKFLTENGYIDTKNYTMHDMVVGLMGDTLPCEDQMGDNAWCNKEGGSK